MSSPSREIVSIDRSVGADCLYRFVPLPSDDAWAYVIGGFAFLILLFGGWGLISHLLVKLFFLVGIVGTIGDGIWKFVDCLQNMEVRIFPHGLSVVRWSVAHYFPWEKVLHVDLRRNTFTLLLLSENGQNSRTMMSSLAKGSLRKFAEATKA